MLTHNMAGYIFYGGNEVLPMSKEEYTFWCIPLGFLFAKSK